jgi:SAM-dependent methyltransferase
MINKVSVIIFAASIIISIIAVLRLSKVAHKSIVEYLNSPSRFCKGKGVEIGSCGAHLVKGSLLVDLVNDFSGVRTYEVDYAADAHALPKINDASLDYICASHVLEHLTNPIKAIIEWSRILKPGGVLWLRVPDKRKTFDITRERTKLAHLIEDFTRDVPADDQTHIEDHNKNTSPPRQQKHPYIHNHVWMLEDIVELFGYLKKIQIPFIIVCCKENSSKNAQDFWVLAKKI